MKITEAKQKAAALKKDRQTQSIIRQRDKIDKNIVEAMVRDEKVVVFHGSILPEVYKHYLDEGYKVETHTNVPEEDELDDLMGIETITRFSWS